MSRQIETGIPETWFRSLLDSNKNIPVGAWAMTMSVAPHFFRSIQRSEVSPFCAFRSVLSPEQTAEMISEGNKFHKELGVKREVTDDDIDLIWTRSNVWLTEGAVELLNWRNAEEGKQPFTELPDRWMERMDIVETEQETRKNVERTERLSAQIENLRDDPVHRQKLAVFIQLAEAGVISFTTESSLRSIERHRELALHDRSYQICAQPALDSFHDNISAAAAREALTIERQLGIKIPTKVIDWF